MRGELSGLSEDQLRDWLAELRRIAALDDATALREVDTLAFGLAAAVESADTDIAQELGRGLEAGKERMKQDLAAARLNLQHPSRIGGFDAVRLRQSAYYTEDEAERQEAATLAEQLDDAFAGAQLRACAHRAYRLYRQPSETLPSDRPCRRGDGEAGETHPRAAAAG